MGVRGSLRSDFDKIINQSNVNGFSWGKFFKFLIINYPHLAGGPKGPLSLPQELEVGGPIGLLYLILKLFLF